MYYFAILFILNLNFISCQECFFNWTWISGSNAGNELYGVYGSVNSSFPGARSWSHSFFDAQKNLLIIGGTGFASNGNPSVLNDVWKFDGTKWIWLNGKDFIESEGYFGVKKVPSESNIIPALSGASKWTNADGNLFIFGGYSTISSTVGYWDALWYFDNNYWTWISGSSSWGNSPKYGRIGIASSLVTPGGRAQCASWIDRNNNLYLFGGNNLPNNYNDFWKFNGVNWTWIGGSNLPNDAGIYNKVLSLSSIPSARRSAAFTKDPFGKFWLFGGFGTNYLNDLWKFDGTYWIWIYGSTLLSISNYGTKGIPSSSNEIGSRSGAVMWSDSVGNIFVFGGFSLGNLNDLWKFNGSIWTWISGSSTPNSLGNYGPSGQFNSIFIPCSRMSPTISQDGFGDVWLFGGISMDFYPGSYFFNDLWRFNGSMWTWISGYNPNDYFGNYGVKGVSSLFNQPPKRQGNMGWIDSQGNPWIFGGRGYSFNTSNAIVPDLWSFSSGQWNWISGPNTENTTGRGNLLEISTLNFPGGRQQAATASYRDFFYLFGGNSTTCRNDLWMFNVSSSMWTFLYGTVAGDEDPPDGPSSRSDASAVTDSRGRFWIFGGQGCVSNSNDFVRHDLWVFEDGVWTLRAGTLDYNSLGAWGTKGIKDSSFVPPARQGMAMSIDIFNTIYIFGGKLNSNSYLHDLWKWDGIWSWIGGDAMYNIDPIETDPGSRTNSFMWNNQGYIWLFGGKSVYGRDYSDIWRFNGNTWRLIYQVPDANFGIKGITKSTNSPGIRTWSFIQLNNAGSAYFFGGPGIDYGGRVISNSNDFWRLDSNCLKNTSPLTTSTLTSGSLTTAQITSDDATSGSVTSGKVKSVTTSESLSGNQNIPKVIVIKLQGTVDAFSSEQFKQTLANVLECLTTDIVILSVVSGSVIITFSLSSLELAKKFVQVQDSLSMQTDWDIISVSYQSFYDSGGGSNVLSAFLQGVLPAIGGILLVALAIIIIVRFRRRRLNRVRIAAVIKNASPNVYVESIAKLAKQLEEEIKMGDIVRVENTLLSLRLQSYPYRHNMQNVFFVTTQLLDVVKLEVTQHLTPKIVVDLLKTIWTYTEMCLIQSISMHSRVYASFKETAIKVLRDIQSLHETEIETTEIRFYADCIKECLLLLDDNAGPFCIFVRSLGDVTNPAAIAMTVSDEAKSLPHTWYIKMFTLSESASRLLYYPSKLNPYQEMKNFLKLISQSLDDYNLNIGAVQLLSNLCMHAKLEETQVYALFGMEDERLIGLNYFVTFSSFGSLEKNINLRLCALKALVAVSNSDNHKIYSAACDLLLIREIEETDIEVSKLFDGLDTEKIGEIWRTTRRTVSSALDRQNFDIKTEQRRLEEKHEELVGEMTLIEVEEKELEVRKAQYKEEDAERIKIALEEYERQMAALSKAMKFQKEEAVAHKLADRERTEITPIDLIHRKIKLENDIKTAKLHLEAKEEIEKNAQRIQEKKKQVESGMLEINKKEQQLRSVLNTWEKKRAKFSQIESDFKVAMQLDAEFLKEKQLTQVITQSSSYRHLQRIPSLASLMNDDDIPDGFLCPITLSLMENPVILVDSGQTYERESINQWLENNKVDPVTKIPITNTILVPNYSLKRAITEWKEKHKK